MVPSSSQRRSGNSSRINLLISFVVHAVVVGALTFFAAREGLLGTELKKIAVQMVKEKPPEPEKPKEPEKPAHAARLKKAPPGLTSPWLVMPPDSSWKLALTPEPTSVLPFRPKRVVELPCELPSSPPEWMSSLVPGKPMLFLP